MLAHSGAGRLMPTTLPWEPRILTGVHPWVPRECELMPRDLGSLPLWPGGSADEYGITFGREHFLQLIESCGPSDLLSRLLPVRGRDLPSNISLRGRVTIGGDTRPRRD